MKIIPKRHLNKEIKEPGDKWTQAFMELNP